MDSESVDQFLSKFSVYRNEYAPAILLDCRGVCYYVYEKFSSAGGDKEDPRLA